MRRWRAASNQIGRLAIIAANLLGAASMLAASASRADVGWPQFRGPSQQGYADDAKLPTLWSETQNIKWKTPLPGEGWSSPVILDHQIWMTTAVHDGRSLRALCVDEESGKLLFNVEVFSVAAPEPKNSFNSYASPTPVIEPGRVYVSFGTYGSACLDSHTAAILWKNNELKLDHKEGPGSSPILWHNYFLLDCDGQDVQYLAALDKLTGKIVYKARRSFPLTTFRPDLRKAYCIPTVINVDGQEELVSVGAHRVYGYAPDDGRELWHLDIPGFSNAPRPVFVDGVVYISTGFANAELWAIDPHPHGPDHTVPVLWQWTRGAPLKPSIMVVNGLVFFTSDSGIARCLDAKTGKQLWQTRMTANISASPIYTHGLIYFFDEHGLGVIIRADRKFTPVAQNQLDGRILASPAVDGNAMFVRTDQAIYRIEEK